MIACSPFAYRGSKWRVASEIWWKLGDPNHYVEPFGGTLATLLSRPPTKQAVPKETVGDLNCLIAHFWRAVRQDPQQVARHFIGPVASIDVQARHRWLKAQTDLVRQNMLGDPNWFDPKIAGWWAWGQDIIVDGDWCGPTEIMSSTLMWTRTQSMIRQHNEIQLAEYFSKLAMRLRNVGIEHKGWRKTLDHGLRKLRGTAGVFLDPPYSRKSGRKGRLYATDDLEVSHDVAEWCCINGKNPRFRIALCGYESEHEMPDDWTCYAWENQNGKSRRKNERIWFSPGCVYDTSSEM